MIKNKIEKPQTNVGKAPKRGRYPSKKTEEVVNKIIEPILSEGVTEKVITKFKDIEGKLLHIKVGNDNFPIFDKIVISEIEGKINDTLGNYDVDCMVIVTHHAVDIQIIETKNPLEGNNGKV